MVTLNNMVLPKIEGDTTTQNYGRFIIGPLERGFGVTIGNALRRVLLSSLEGAAVTTLRVMGVAHEFSAIPHVKEDMTQLILQVKKLRLKLLDAESARMYLAVQGEGVITAADITPTPEVEIINPDLYLFTIDTPGATVEMEFNVEAGRGYSPAEERGRMVIGELPVDAIFSPITRVNFRVERARVGQKTNYDRLILEIWTDGTITPEEAMNQAAGILINHLGIIAAVDPGEFLEKAPVLEEEPEEAQGGPAPETYDIPIEQLDLSVRVFNSLKRTGITNVGEVLEMLERGPDAMLAIRNFGEKSLEELQTLLREKGFLPSEDDEEAAK
ncbi:MAG: DNA-directed RNA polymerase subunit alpha [Chloroflexi bacterium]|nr:DNA-directed RNA polymerase subunit alpha [Chloroflexota bacterium]